ncbi:MAG: hypothetical protein ACOCQ4_02970 [bacterium]
MSNKQAFTNSIVDKLKQKYGENLDDRIIQVKKRDNDDLVNFIRKLKAAEEDTKNSTLVFR